MEGTMNMHIDKNIGQVSAGIQYEEKKDMHGKKCYRAFTVITSIFGCDPDCFSGPTLEGFGVTKEQARERLAEEERKFNDSLFV